MTLEELIAVVKKFEILFQQMSRQKISGAANSLFKGRGLNFDSIRQYQAGDDVRTINWNVTARLRATHTNTYTEDKERLIWIMIDISLSNNFGTIRRTKFDLELEIAISMAYSALKTNNTVGVIFFSDRIEKLVQPAKGMANFWYIAKLMTEITPTAKTTNLAAAMEFLMKITAHNSTVVILSDFLTRGYGQISKIIAQKHELVAIRVYDKHEYELPNLGWVKLKDIESGETRWANTASANFANHYHNQYQVHQDYFNSVYQKHHLKNAAFATDEDVAPKFIKLMGGTNA